jgi:conjugative transposon TraJ protein
MKGLVLGGGLGMFRVFGMAAVLVLFFPVLGFSQDSWQQTGSLQSVLDRVYNEMIPMCSELIHVGRVIAGFGALWYIASRVWRHISAAEPVDFYPLMRPFGLGLAILLFPGVLAVMNGVLKPTVAGTAKMVKGSDEAIKALLKLKEQELKKSERWKLYVGEDGRGDREEWYKYTYRDNPDASGEGFLESFGNDIRFWADRADYKMRHSFKQFIAEVLQVVYYAASLCINTLRTFFLIVLAILGPLVLGFAVFDGMQHTLSVWIARYINIYLWLPIANIFGAILGKIQQNMIKIDISQVQNNGDTFFSPTDLAYMIFLIIGILGYFCVPTVANYVIHAGGGNSILSKVNAMTAGGTSSVKQGGMTSMAGAKYGVGMIIDAFGDGKKDTSQGMAEASGQDYFKDKLTGDKKS